MLLDFWLSRFARIPTTPMTLPDGYSAIAPGKIASVVTYLEMREPPVLSPVAPPPHLSFRRVLVPDVDWYRQLYRLVGENWLWFSRLRLTDAELQAVLHHPAIEIYALTQESADSAGDSTRDSAQDKGLVELDLRTASEVEIASFGLSTDLIGQGAGHYLMTEALRAAWSHDPLRVWLHTCTIDSSQALSFYLKWGFIPYKRAIEVDNDPRITGDIARSAAPHFPIMGG